MVSGTNIVMVCGLLGYPNSWNGTTDRIARRHVTRRTGSRNIAGDTQEEGLS